jgi:hypothetical protein
MWQAGSKCCQCVLGSQPGGTPMANDHDLGGWRSVEVSMKRILENPMLPPTTRRLVTTNSANVDPTLDPAFFTGATNALRILDDNRKSNHANQG